MLLLDLFFVLNYETMLGKVELFFYIFGSQADQEQNKSEVEANLQNMGSSGSRYEFRNFKNLEAKNKIRLEIKNKFKALNTVDLTVDQHSSGRFLINENPRTKTAQDRLKIQIYRMQKQLLRCLKQDNHQVQRRYYRSCLRMKEKN